MSVRQKNSAPGVQKNSRIAGHIAARSESCIPFARFEDTCQSLWYFAHALWQHKTHSCYVLPAKTNYCAHPTLRIHLYWVNVNRLLSTALSHCEDLYRINLQLTLDGHARQDNHKDVHASTRIASYPCTPLIAYKTSPQRIQQQLVQMYMSKLGKMRIFFKSAWSKLDAVDIDSLSVE